MNTYTLGQEVTLPDGCTVTLTAISTGVEYTKPVIYLTGVTRLGTTQTRWVAA